jgi:hypothetical protein
MNRALHAALLAAASLAACAEPAPPPAVAVPAVASAPAKPSIVAQLRDEARAVEPLVKSGLAKELLAGAADLPAQAPRRLWHDVGKTRFYTEAQRARLGEAERRGLYAEDYDEEYFYETRYGTPLAYARPLDLLGLGKDGLAGKRVLDFGFGGIGQLWLLAALGARVTGIEIDPLQQALYSWPGDLGARRGRLGQDGEVRLLFGSFPAERAITEAAGGGYDLFLSKNVLKRGYIHPERFAPEKRLIHLGVDDETFVRTLHGMLAPGGHVLIYNLTPAQAPLDQPYIPWADGRCPFARELWEKVGFRVIDFDRDDTPAAHALGHALGWDQGDDKEELFGMYTLIEKPRG